VARTGVNVAAQSGDVLRYNHAVDLERLEGIELVGADDAPHRLGDYWADRPVILVFLRHFG